MDLLKFGMENEKSASAVKRAMAKAALETAKKQADLYENYLEKHTPAFPEADAEELLKKIREEIGADEDATSE